MSLFGGALMKRGAKKDYSATKSVLGEGQPQCQADAGTWKKKAKKVDSPGHGA